MLPEVQSRIRDTTTSKTSAELSFSPSRSTLPKLVSTPETALDESLQSSAPSEVIFSSQSFLPPLITPRSQPTGTALVKVGTYSHNTHNPTLHTPLNQTNQHQSIPHKKRTVIQNKPLFIYGTIYETIRTTRGQLQKTHTT